MACPLKSKLYQTDDVSKQRVSIVSSFLCVFVRFTDNLIIHVFLSETVNSDGCVFFMFSWFFKIAL